MDIEKIDRYDKKHKYGHSNCRKVILQNCYNNCNSEICVFSLFKF